MKVFVTGGTGYIGSRLIPLLLQRGHSVKALVRKGRSEFVKRCHKHQGGAVYKPPF